MTPVTGPEIFIGHSVIKGLPMTHTLSWYVRKIDNEEYVF